MLNRTTIVAASLATLLASTAPAAWAATTELVSVSTAGQQANDNSFDPSVSGDGRYVVFESLATNLGGGNDSHLYIRDRVAHTTTVVDVSTGGQLANSYGLIPIVARDGSHVAFFSEATNLVTGDTNGVGDVFERDLKAGTTVRVSVKSNGQQPHHRNSYPDAISADGRYVAFETSAPNLTGNQKRTENIFVHDLTTGKTLLISKGLGGQLANGFSNGAGMSGDGRFVVYGSSATNIVAGNNGKGGVYLWDRQSGKTVRVDLGTNGQQGNEGGFSPFVSDDGSVVAFASEATNLVPSATSGNALVYVRDVKAGTTILASRATGGGEPNDSVYLYGLSADGRYVLMQSDATNLVAGDTNNATDVFVYDRNTGTTSRADLTAGGGQPSQGVDDVGAPSISSDGGTVAFDSPSADLVAGDANGAIDVFVRTGLGAAARIANAR